MKLSSKFVCLIALAVAIGCIPNAHAETLNAKFLPDGMTRLTGGYRPIRSIMDEDESSVKVAPEELKAPLYGKFRFEKKSWAYILDEPQEGEARLYLDSNGDGDLTNDPKVPWKAIRRGEFKQYSGDGRIELGNGQAGRIVFYRFDPKDERRKGLEKTVLFYGDFGYEYKLELDGKPFDTFVSGFPNEESRLPIDRDGNGKISSRLEVARVGRPFNFTGTTYVIELDDGELRMDQSPESAEQTPLPPNLVVGQPALNFTAKTMTGEEIRFPQSFAGKVVMLDFWATWCRPCLGEIPNMKEAYANWREQGFEILGVSFDREEMDERIEKFLARNDQSWPQIYDGKSWASRIGQMHDVSAIPFVLLVDGDSGEILATTKQLRGPELSQVIQRELEKKFDTKLEPPKKPKSEGDDLESDDQDKKPTANESEGKPNKGKADAVRSNDPA